MKALIFKYILRCKWTPPNFDTLSYRSEWTNDGSALILQIFKKIEPKEQEIFCHYIRARDL